MTSLLSLTVTFRVLLTNLVCQKYKMCLEMCVQCGHAKLDN